MGDVIKVRTPAGKQELEIVAVCYRETNKIRLAEP